MEMKDILELQAQTQAEVQGLLSGFQTKVREMVGEEALKGHLGVYMREMARRSEEVMHRANDCLTVMMASTVEGQESILEEAKASGNIQAPEGVTLG